VTGSPRRVAVLTGTRADYGLLSRLARALDADRRTELLLIVSGSHLSQRHGNTVDEIVADGVPVADRVPIWGDSDEPEAVAQDFGTAVGLFAGSLRRLGPDVVVVLGDRLEALAMATAATILGIPVAHIHGGELTEGAMDESLRHAITKLSSLHFVTTDEHRRRVIQLGEQPDRVLTLGAPVLDAIAELHLLNRDELRRRFGISFGAITVLLTFHPAAFDPVPSVELLGWLLSAVDAQPGAHLIITGTNSDIGSDEIRAVIADYVRANPGTTDYVESFGQLGYLSTMGVVDLVVGNSSSTVLEAPLLGIPSVLVGDRQEGRPLSPSVLRPSPDATAILEAVSLALAPTFRASFSGAPSVFGTPGFARRAVEVLASADLLRTPRKRFNDLSTTPPNDGNAQCQNAC